MGSSGPPAAEARLYRDRNLQVIFGVTLMAVLGVNSITPAFPEMVRELNIGKESVGLLITAFTFPGVVLSPFLGVLADRLGRKRVLVPSLFLFAVAGSACTFSRDFDTLLVLRVLQGIGGAGLGSLNLTLIGDLYSGRRRTEAMGLNASVLSMGTALYPSMGGALALLGWYYPFALSLAAIPVGILALTSLHNPEPKSSQGLRQYLGGIWHYLKSLRLAGLFAAGVLFFIILYGAYLTYLPLHMGESFAASPLTIGIILSSMSLTTAAVSWQLGRITKWLSEGTLIRIGFLIYGVSLAMIPFMPRLWLLLIPAVIFGLGNGLNVPSLQTLVAGAAPLEHRAAFMSINATMIRLGQTLGPLLTGLAYVHAGMEATFLASALLALAAAVVATLASRLMSR